MLCMDVVATVLLASGKKITRSGVESRPRAVKRTNETHNYTSNIDGCATSNKVYRALTLFLLQRRVRDRNFNRLQTSKLCHHLAFNVMRFRVK